MISVLKSVAVRVVDAYFKCYITDGITRRRNYRDCMITCILQTVDVHALNVVLQLDFLSVAAFSPDEAVTT